MSLLSAFKMTCREATFLHEKKRDGVLTASEKFGLWWHGVICGLCAAFFKQVEHLEKQSYNMCHHAEKTITLSPAQKEAIQRAFKEQLKNN